MNFPPTSTPETHLDPANSRPAPPRPTRNRVRPRSRKIDVPRGGKMEGSGVREKIAIHGVRNSDGELYDIPEALKHKHKTVFGIDYETINDATTQPTSLLLTHHCSLGTSSLSTYYLRNLQTPYIEGSTIDVKKEQRGVMATQTAATAAGTKTFTEAEKMPPRLMRCSTEEPAKLANKHLFLFPKN